MRVFVGWSAESWGMGHCGGGGTTRVWGSEEAIVERGHRGEEENKTMWGIKPIDFLFGTPS